MTRGAVSVRLYCKGLAIAPIAVVTTLNFTIPLFTLVMARIFLKETVDKTRWIGTLAGFAGVMVVGHGRNCSKCQSTRSPTLISRVKRRLPDVLSVLCREGRAWQKVLKTSLNTWANPGFSS